MGDIIDIMNGSDESECCVIMIITTVAQYVYKYKQTLSFQTGTGLLISDFGPWRHEERDTILKSLC